MVSRRPGCRPIGAPAGAVLVALLAVLILGACSDEQRALPRGEFEQHLVEREGFTTDEADCVADRVYAGYTDDVITALDEGGLRAVPPAQHSTYVYGVVACTMADELGVTTEPAP